MVTKMAFLIENSDLSSVLLDNVVDSFKNIKTIVYDSSVLFQQISMFINIVTYCICI